jgi:hypothetical protein
MPTAAVSEVAMKATAGNRIGSSRGGDIGNVVRFFSLFTFLALPKGRTVLKEKGSPIKGPLSTGQTLPAGNKVSLESPQYRAKHKVKSKQVFKASNSAPLISVDIACGDTSSR